METGPIPQIEKEKIGPETNLPEEKRAERKERREKEDSLANYILKWWKGEAHTHSKESTHQEWGYVEGIYDIEETLAYADKLGLEFVAFAEHSSKPGSPEVQSPDSKISTALLAEAERIKAINQERKGAVAFSAVEVNIVFDQNGKSTLDLPPEVLGKLDLVIASRHTIAQEKDLPAIKESLLATIKNPQVDVIGHPDRMISFRGDWNMLCAHSEKSQSYHQAMVQKQQQEREARDPQEKERLSVELKQAYATIDKVIGKKKTEPGDEGNETLLQLLAERDELESRTWPMWEEIVAEMATNGKAFEINLNNPPHPRLLEIAAKAGVRFFINYDAHDFNQYKKERTALTDTGEKAKQRWAKEELTEEDQRTLEGYKLARLQAGPGVVAILRLVRHLKKLESLGVTPERVVNSSRARLLTFLTQERGKKTENLAYLTK